MPEPPAPVCPLCGEFPLWVLGGGTQAFCGNHDCPVMTWNPMENRDHFLQTARVARVTQGGQETITRHWVYCRTCRQSWIDGDGCACTCRDGQPGYEDWVVDPDPADIAAEAPDE